MLLTLLYVALGSAAGGSARWFIALQLQPRFGTFPWATLLINVTGSFLLGLILRASLGHPALTPNARALLATGFCGGYTTFSTFSFETATLIERGEYGRVAGYVVLSVLVSLVATFAGFAVAGALYPPHAER